MLVYLCKLWGNGMEIKFKKNNSSLTIYIYGELDECSSHDARNVLDKLINDNIGVSCIIFNLSGLTFMDSTGIGLLIGRYKKLKQLNIQSYITGATVATEKVIELAGLYGIMPKY